MILPPSYLVSAILYEKTDSMWKPADFRSRKSSNDQFPTVVAELQSTAGVISKKENPEGKSNDDIPRNGTLSENFREYLLSTSIHGLKYIGDINLSTFERLFFVISFLTVSILSGYFISNVWQKWSETPVIIGLNPMGTPLNHIPFPAVTICNVNQARKSAVQYIKAGSLDDSLLESLCGRGDEFTPNAANQTGKWSYFRNFLLNVSQPCKDMLIMCRYSLRQKPCLEIFASILTDEGLCCTFNTVHPNFMFFKLNFGDVWNLAHDDSKYIPIDWTPEKGFPTDIKNNTYPRRAAGAGTHMGLSVVINAATDDYYCSSISSAGFKILLHNPTETPKIAEFGFLIAPGEEVRAVIAPRINDASDLIRKIPIKQRQCVFASEGNLSYFRTYSKKNCEMECESGLIEEFCGCVLYYMPKTTEETKICSRRDAICYEEIKIAIELQNNESFSCRCLPACFEIGYDRELSASKLGTGIFALRENILEQYEANYVLENIAVVHLFFVETTFRSFTKGELIGFTEFLSNTGGLLGLFMGFSVLSVMEIFYFISFRPYCIKRRFNHRQTQNRTDENQSSNTGADTVRMVEPFNQLNGVPNVISDFRNYQQPDNRNGKILKSSKHFYENWKDKIVSLKDMLSGKESKKFDIPPPPYPYLE